MERPIKFPDWQTPYEDALSESDIRKLALLVDAAEIAIFQRLEGMEDHPGSFVEFQALDAALTNLLVLKAGAMKVSQSHKNLA
jgi:hypothetical protein